MRDGGGAPPSWAAAATAHSLHSQTFIFDYGEGVLGGPDRGPAPTRRADAGFADVPGDPFDEAADVAPPPPAHTGPPLAARPVGGG